MAATHVIHDRVLLDNQNIRLSQGGSWPSLAGDWSRKQPLDFLTVMENQGEVDE